MDPSLLLCGLQVFSARRSREPPGLPGDHPCRVPAWEASCHSAPRCPVPSDTLGRAHTLSIAFCWYTWEQGTQGAQFPVALQGELGPCGVSDREADGCRGGWGGGENRKAGSSGGDRTEWGAGKQGSASSSPHTSGMPESASRAAGTAPAPHQPSGEESQMLHTPVQAGD